MPQCLQPHFDILQSKSTSFFSLSLSLLWACKSIFWLLTLFILGNWKFCSDKVTKTTPPIHTTQTIPYTLLSSAISSLGCWCCWKLFRGWWWFCGVKRERYLITLKTIWFFLRLPSLKTSPHFNFWNRSHQIVCVCVCVRCLPQKIQILHVDVSCS